MCKSRGKEPGMMERLTITERRDLTVGKIIPKRQENRLKSKGVNESNNLL